MSLEGKDILSVTAGVYSLFFGFVSIFLFGVCLSCHTNHKFCGASPYAYTWGLGYGSLGICVLYSSLFSSNLKKEKIIKTSFLAFVFFSMLYLILAYFLYEEVYLGVFEHSPLLEHWGTLLFLFLSLIPAIFLLLSPALRRKNYRWRDLILPSTLAPLSSFLLGTALYRLLPEHRVPCPWPGISYLLILLILSVAIWLSGKKGGQKRSC